MGAGAQKMQDSAVAKDEDELDKSIRSKTRTLPNHSATEGVSEDSRSSSHINRDSRSDFKMNKGAELTEKDVELLEQIGEGSFCKVHRGKFRRDRSIVAVKILKHQSPDTKTLDSFRQEIWLHSQIRHPHVIQFFGGCTVVPKLCLVTEFMF